MKKAAAAAAKLGHKKAARGRLGEKGAWGAPRFSFDRPNGPGLVLAGRANPKTGNPDQVGQGVPSPNGSAVLGSMASSSASVAAAASLAGTVSRT